MLRPVTLIGVCLAALTAMAQDNQAGKANEMFQAGRRLEALPLYEDLARENPKEWLYAERLADCLTVKELQMTDPAEIKAVRIRERDEAKRAIALGDPHVYVQTLANLNIDGDRKIAPSSPASALLNEGEKAFTTGDFAAALAQYIAAAEADPTLYEAPLFAGDTAYSQKDLKTAGIWFAKAIDVNPNRETAYRYWGDAMMRLGGDPVAAKSKFIDGIVAEPYSKYSWQGINQWAQFHKAVVMAPKLDRPSAPVTDPKKPNNITININPDTTDDKKHPGASAWLMYSLIRAGYHGDTFKKDFPNEKEYRHTLKEEDTALAAVVESLDTKKIEPEKLDESLRNLLELHKAGMLDCWILISAADNGIAQDYDAYRKDHRQLLHDYLEKFVVHGGVGTSQ
jgi:tetratricopeptide (TPR) repeat protein